MYYYRSDRIKKKFNSLSKVSIFGWSILNVDLVFLVDQLKIDYLEEIFFEILEIFLAAVEKKVHFNNILAFMEKRAKIALRPSVKVRLKKL